MQGFGKYNFSQKFPKGIKLSIIILFLLISLGINPWIWRLCEGNKPSFHFNLIFTTTSEDIHKINTRRSYYSNQFLGKIFENKLTFYLDKYQKNFLQGLDLNYYFFVNHPRERPGVAEQEIFFWFWLPIFLVGFFWSLKKSFLIHNLVFLTSLSFVSFFTQIDSFLLILFPLLSLNSYLGLRRLIS